MKCNICDSEIAFRKAYNKHVSYFSFRIFIKKILPYFDSLIPGFLTKIKRHSGGHSQFTGYINVCGQCGHGEMDNPPSESELQDYYQDKYWSLRSNTVGKSVKGDKAYTTDPRAVHQIGLILKNIECDTIENILEIGAGSAYASLLLREKCQNTAMNLHVCEPGQQWEDYYQRHGIIKVADYFPFETDKQFDYVHTSHWLEHTLDLNETLSSLKSIITPSGYLFIEVPNTGHFYWDLPEEDTPHIQFFTRESLARALEKFNFRCLNIGEYGISFMDKHKGIPLTNDRYGAYEKGFWIRGIFKKIV